MFDAISMQFVDSNHEPNNAHVDTVTSGDDKQDLLDINQISEST
jgi:hypothetical protein